MTASDALGEQPQAACRAVAPFAEPLIVDWKSQERLDLELAMKEGLVVVAHDCKQLRVLKTCKAKGSYPFVGVSRKEQVIELTNLDDLAATVPLGAARFGAELQRGSAIQVGMVLVGKRSTTVRGLAKVELEGDCEGATHYVRAATVGAFSVGTSTSGKVKAVAEVFGAGMSGGSASTAKNLNRDGDLDACKAAKSTDANPPDQCQSAIRLELAPISPEAKPMSAPEKGAKQEAQPACPDGTVREAGACVAHAKGPYACNPKEHAQCEQQCEKGNAESCYHAAAWLWTELWMPDSKAPPGSEQKAKDMFAKACEGDYAAACYEIGSSLDTKDYKDASTETALKALQKACELGYGDACWTLGRVLQKGTIVTRDSEQAVALARRGCLAGSFLACSDWASIYEHGNGVARDLAKANEVQEMACDAKDYLSCQKIAERNVKLGRFADAARFYDRVCRVHPSTCPFPPGASAPKDDASARKALEDSCAKGNQSICYVLKEPAKGK